MKNGNLVDGNWRISSKPQVLLSESGVMLAITSTGTQRCYCVSLERLFEVVNVFNNAIVVGNNDVVDMATTQLSPPITVVANFQGK